MGLIKTAVLGLIVLYVISIFLRSNENIVTDLPNIWWGPGVENKNVDKTIRPFKVVFKKEVNNFISLTLYIKLTRFSRMNFIQFDLKFKLELHTEAKFYSYMRFILELIFY